MKRAEAVLTSQDYLLVGISRWNANLWYLTGAVACVALLLFYFARRRGPPADNRKQASLEEPAAAVAVDKAETDLSLASKMTADNLGMCKSCQYVYRALPFLVFAVLLWVVSNILEPAITRKAVEVDFVRLISFLATMVVVVFG